MGPTQMVTMPHAPEIGSSDRLLTLGRKLGRVSLQGRGEGACVITGCFLAWAEPPAVGHTVAWDRESFCLLALVTAPAVSLEGLGGAADSDASHYL